MSFLHPTADVNSAGEERDPIKGVRLDRAEKAADAMLRDPHNPTGLSSYFNWQRIREDIIHFTPLDDLPEAQRDAIRKRRRKAFMHSDVPWIITDFTSLMTAFDDVDDLLKTKTLIHDYALTPAARAARRLTKGKNPFRDEKLAGWDESCGVPAAPRERKLTIPGFGGLNLLAFLGLGALGALFPGWRLAALLFQALQTTDSMFGVGVQLGPVIGAAMETFFRIAKEVGGPITEFTNKYEQLKAARVLQNIHKSLAAAPRGHPDDALTTLTGLWYASGDDVAPYFVVASDDYPSLADVYESPWAIGKEGFDAVRLAASLPYNLGAALANRLLADSMGSFSTLLGGPGDLGMPDEVPDNETTALMKLAELGICPAGQCEGELAMDALLLANAGDTKVPGQSIPLTPEEMAKNLGLSVQQPQSLLPDPPPTSGKGQA